MLLKLHRMIDPGIGRSPQRCIHTPDGQIVVELHSVMHERPRLIVLGSVIPILLIITVRELVYGAAEHCFQAVTRTVGHCYPLFDSVEMSYLDRANRSVSAPTIPFLLVVRRQTQGKPTSRDETSLQMPCRR